MKNILQWLKAYRFHVSLALVAVANNLWFVDYVSIWFITFAILILMPILGVGYLFSLILLVVDGFFKIVSFWFKPSLIDLYGYYLASAFAVVSLVSLMLKRLGKERLTLLSDLHKIRSESIDLESSLPEALSMIPPDGKRPLTTYGLLREREDTYRNILNIIKQSFHPYSIVLYFYNQADSSFYVRESISESEHFSAEPVSSDSGVLHALLKERRIINARRIQSPHHLVPYYTKKEEIRSFLAVPIMSGMRFKGALCLDSLSQDVFSTKEEEIIRKLCQEIVKAIDSSEKMKGLAKIKEELENVCELGTRLNSTLSAFETIDTLMEISRRFVEWDFSCFVSYDPDSDKNRIVRIRAGREQTYEGRDFSCDDRLGIVSWVIKNNVPLEYCQIKGKKKEIILFNRNLRVPFTYNSVLILPLRAYNRVQGAFIVASQRGNICREEDKRLLEGICGQVGISLENSKMYASLKHLATSDGLTGLVNHRVFQEALGKEVERFSRYPDSFSLLLIDIDHFKSFNDRYGHPIGDFVLKEISKVLQGAVRKIDMAARYGGEEFAIILVNTARDGAMKMADRIRSEVAARQFVTGELLLKVTLSIGVAAFPECAKTKQELVESADRALYAAKAAGRNRVVYCDSVARQTSVASKSVLPLTN